ncbi:hypothetical protein [Parabacteroides sp. FAFU027]|uniref:hypothetical protein n=1 Tax=Parabacteroides sp. FAFU027 TaxID=2922715 RepID=UPI001FAFBC13|nr:hypothetical protein [Parabacteroides sp. FAFU027]
MRQTFKLRKLSILLSLFLTAGFFVNAYAQKDSIKWGIEQQYHKRGLLFNVEIFKTDSNYIYYYGHGMKVNFDETNFIVKHNKNTGKNELCDIQLKRKEYQLNIVGHYFINDTLHIFSSYYNNKLNKSFLFHETYNLDKLQSNDDINKITEIDYKALAGGEKASLEYFDFKYINNHFLLRYSCKSKKGQIFGLEVLDKTLHKEWSSPSIALTESGVNYESNYYIDNEGNLYGLQRNFENEKDVNKHFEHSRIWAVCYPKGGGEPKSLALILKDDNFITSEQLSVNEKGEVICAGLYARPGTTSAVGCFSFVIEPLLAKLKSVNSQEFSPSFLTKGLDMKSQEKSLDKILKSKDFENNFGYKINSIHFRKDGSFDVVAEKYKQEIIRFRDNITTYNYNDDLSVLTFNADGSVKWVQKIPKYEYVQDLGSLTGSYFLSYDKDDNMTFIFNLIQTGVLSFSYKKAKTVRMTLDKNGNENFKELIGDYKTALLMCPGFFYKQNDNTLLLSKYNYETVFDGLAGSKNTITFGELNLQ